MKNLGVDLTKILGNISRSLSSLLKKEDDAQYLVVYETEEMKTKSYIISRPDLYDSFGNKSEERDNVGFRAFCYGRNEVRSFRHDRIKSITKL
tara:strand:- start:187 stop:465 length:279 start_codon:yes stop_codon:yes gene_type:complete